MCGIMGYAGNRSVPRVLLSGLKRLEYRGYDSAGVAYFVDGRLEIQKAEGKLCNVEKLLHDKGFDHVQNENGGIGHTRWATHGRPTTQNAHPHKTGPIALVHNGIIENYQDIKCELLEKGHRPLSETDSELFGYLVLEEQKKGHSFVEAVRQSFLKVEGSCSVVLISEEEPGMIVGIRNGSPLVVALDPQGGVFFASDAQAIIEYTNEVAFVEMGDLVVGHQVDGRYQLDFYDSLTGTKLDRTTTKLNWSVESLDKQGYPHYMLKEIFEQPQSWIDTLNLLLDRAKQDPFPLAAQPSVELLRRAKQLQIIACGTSWHAALLGKYWIERWAKITVQVELASEFRYRDPVLSPDTLVIGISQSGETADTLGAIREMRSRGIPTLGICNVRGSSMAREADAALFTAAGPEVGVAATKTFTSQLLSLLVLAGALGCERKTLSLESGRELFDEVLRLPHFMDGYLHRSSQWLAQIDHVSKQVYRRKGFFFMGRGYSFPIALEGALKLKEIAYINAEGYAAGELKHGPIAMIDDEMVVVVLAPRDRWREKTISNLQEVKSRGACIIGIGNSDDQAFEEMSDFWIPLNVPKQIRPELFEALYPFLLVPAVQLLSYQVAVLRGTDVDQPRNLAKSVTVE